MAKVRNWVWKWIVISIAERIFENGIRVNNLFLQDDFLLLKTTDNLARSADKGLIKFELNRKY